MAKINPTNSLNHLFKMGLRLKREARRLKMSYDCNISILGIVPSETRVEEGYTYLYPSRVDLAIENWNTWKGSFRLTDSQFIREGADLNGAGLSVPRMYRRMLRELRDHARIIALHEEARSSNCVVYRGALVVVENADATEFGPERIFEVFDKDGNKTCWYGKYAEDALNNMAPFMREFSPVLIRVKENPDEAE